MWSFRSYGDRVAVIDDNNVCKTYHQLANDCEAWARHVPRRSLIFILSSNTMGSLIAYVACLNERVVPVMLDAQIDSALLSHYVEVYKPCYIWTPASRSSDFKGDLIFSDWEYALICCRVAENAALYSDLGLLLTTSGSTGSPRFVRQSYENISQNAHSIMSYLDLDESEKAITTLPMNYTYGLSIINSHLMVGATLILTEKTLIQREFWNMFVKYQVTSFGGVPYTYEILDKLMFFRRDLPSLRTMTQAGGKLSPLLHRKFADYALKKGKRFVVMYGASEATARMAYLPSERSLEKCGAIGIAIPGGRLMLMDERSEIITTSDTIGELVYEGKNVTLGYAERREDLCRGDERNGILHTGDLAKRDSDGFYYIVGRKKRFLKIFGHRIGLEETELLIREHYPECECACVGKDDSMYVFVDSSEKCDEIRRFLADKMKLNISAFHVRYLAALPKNNVGKILYNKLEMLREENNPI